MDKRLGKGRTLRTGALADSATGIHSSSAQRPRLARSLRDVTKLLRNTLSPCRILPILWVGCLLAYVGSFGEIPTFKVIAWVVAAVSAFSLGAAIDFNVRVKNASSNSLSSIAFVCIALFPIQIFYLYQCALLITSQGLVGYLVNVRLAALSGEPLIDNYTFFLQINTTLSLLTIFGLATILLDDAKRIKCAAHEKYKIIFYTVCVVTLMASIIDGSRSFFLVTIFSLAALNLATGRLSVNRLAIISIAVFVIFTATFSLFRPEAEDFDLVGLIRQSLVYLCGSLGSMDPVLSDEITVYWQDVERISNKLTTIGLPFHNYDLSELKADYTDLPYDLSTNVYSAFGLYYQYLGVFGGMVALMAIGVVSGVSYKNRLKSPLCLSIYCAIWPAIILTPFHDYFAQQGYSILKLAIYILLLRAICSLGRAAFVRVPVQAR